MPSTKYPGVPSIVGLIKPVYYALLVLGGEAKSEDIRKTLIEMYSLSADATETRHIGAANMTQLAYNQTRTMQYLVSAGIVEKTEEQGCWRIKSEYRCAPPIDVDEIRRIHAIKHPSRHG